MLVWAVTFTLSFGPLPTCKLNLKMSAEASTSSFKYPEWAKMPGGYSFDTRGKDWGQYEKHFLLRTDAVYEKKKLTDFFRTYFKCFFFDSRINDYVITEPDDIYQNTFESFNHNDEYIPFPGFTATGRTSSFQVGKGPKDKVKVTAQTNMAKIDYYELCALRFEKWYMCD